MKSGSGATASIWMATAEIPIRPALAKDITADVCVVGTGIAGLTRRYAITLNHTAQLQAARPRPN